MARVVKQHAVRQREILDTAQRLVYSKGYEQMTVQDILDTLQIAKGTFFHYFNSKQALLEALVDRMMEEMDQVIAPVMHDPNLSAIERLQSFFATTARWKVTQKVFLLQLLHVWYADHNAILRQKVRAAAFKRFAPFINAIACQGVQEGIFTTPYPEQIGEVVFVLIEGLGDSFVEPLLANGPRLEDLPRAESAVCAYTDALERVLGAPHGSVQLLDGDTLQEWFDLREEGDGR
ncbi:MAG TPA: TetR/AcrR family transcriptional regulator [Chloroflexota bacterium]|nr:TetR/AcrR family transcriptional regulator [Chloroflexota bacterium]